MFCPGIIGSGMIFVFSFSARRCFQLGVKVSSTAVSDMLGFIELKLGPCGIILLKEVSLKEDLRSGG